MTKEERQLVDEILEEHEEEITAEARDAFHRWRREDATLTPKMRAWLFGVGERRGLAVAPAENVFSQMSPEKQAEQRARAAKIRLPWEK